jgi:mRNA interferase MazF
MKIERGEIWWINLDPTIGREIKKRRPCVVISSNVINRIRSTPVIVPLSSSPESAPPVIIPVPSAGKESVAVIDQIRAVDKSRFASREGTVSSNDLHNIEQAVKQILQLP